jgi:hypothetical protein
MRCGTAKHTTYFARQTCRVTAFVLASLPLASPASAHIKWFAAFEVAGQPRLLERVVGPDFVALSLLALTILLFGCILDRTPLGGTIARALDRITLVIRVNADVLLRAIAAFFFIALWTIGGIFLTPELKTDLSWVPQLQLAMAASLLSRRTALFAGLGIIVLYASALRVYGIFHLLDYPIFLAVGVYLIVQAVKAPSWLTVRPLDILRYGAAVTLMWASIEKWAYPEWTLPIYVSHPAMSMGYDFELFMQAAGVIEFTLAFALLWTPLVRRAASFVLLGMFIGATAEFGKIDVIGHSVIVAVLMLLAADDRRLAPERRTWRWIAAPTLAYTAALVAFLSVYYGMHSFLFGTAII